MNWTVDSLLKYKSRFLNTQCSNLIIFHDIFSRNHMHLLPDIFISLYHIFHYILNEWMGTKFWKQNSTEIHMKILSFYHPDFNEKTPFSIPISSSQGKIICFHHNCVFYRAHHSLRCRCIGGKRLYLRDCCAIVVINFPRRKCMYSGNLFIKFVVGLWCHSECCQLHLERNYRM